VSGLPDRQVGLSLPGKQLSGSPYPGRPGRLAWSAHARAPWSWTTTATRCQPFTARGSTITD